MADSSSNTVSTKPTKETSVELNGGHCYENTISISQMNSPFIDKKLKKKPLLSSALTLMTTDATATPSPQRLVAAAAAAAAAASSPVDSEHQYDIPFSHLTPRAAAAKAAAVAAAAGTKNSRHRRASSPQSLSSSSGAPGKMNVIFKVMKDIHLCLCVLVMSSSPAKIESLSLSSEYEMELTPRLSSFPNPPPHPRPPRRIRSSQNNNGDVGSLLQPRMVDAATGASGCNGNGLASRGLQWSGSERSVNTSIYSGMRGKSLNGM